MCAQPNVNEAAAAAAAALRREARRRKILENSANRLRLIEGVFSSDERQPFSECKENSQTCASRLEVRSDRKLAENEEEAPNDEIEIQSSMKLPEFRDNFKENKNVQKKTSTQVSNGSNEMENFKLDFLESLTSTREEEEEEDEEEDKLTALQIMFKKRMHYVLLAVFVNFLIFLNVGYYFYNNIFCPFLTVELVEFLSSRKDTNITGALSQMLLLNGMPKKVQKYAKTIVHVIPLLFSDLLLYLFAFIMGTKILNLNIM